MPSFAAEGGTARLDHAFNAGRYAGPAVTVSGMGKARATAATPPPQRASRDRGATEARILSAVGQGMARDGFGGTGINAIAKQAGGGWAARSLPIVRSFVD
jgi:hypothetical protein